MNHYAALRERAKAAYKAACAKARRDLLRTLKQIDTIAASLGERRHKAYAPRSIINVIADLIPRDRVFSVVDLYKLVTQADMERPCSYATVKSYMAIYEKEGRVRRVRRERRIVLYADKRLKVEDEPYTLLAHWEVAQDIDRGSVQN